MTSFYSTSAPLHEIARGTFQFWRCGPRKSFVPMPLASQRENRGRQCQPGVSGAFTEPEAHQPEIAS